MIALLDYGAGNVRSVQKSLTAAGGDVQLVPSPELVKQADAVVLPGVGAFDDSIQSREAGYFAGFPSHSVVQKPGPREGSAGIPRLRK